MSAENIDFLIEAFAAFAYPFSVNLPFANTKDMHGVIDSTPLGDAPWRSFTVHYTGAILDGEVPSWMSATYDI